MDYKNHKDYKAIQETISSLELQLQEVDEIPALNISAIETEVNNHFEVCINALLRRKEDIIKEVAQLSLQQETLKTKVKSELKESIELHKDTLDAGVNIYHKRVNMAEQFWHVAYSMKLPEWNREELLAKVNVTLPDTLLDTIHSHGDVSTNTTSLDFTNVNTELELNIDLSDNPSSSTAYSNFNSNSNSNFNSNSSLSQYTTTTTTSTSTTTTAPSSPPISPSAPPLSLMPSSTKFNKVNKVISIAGSTRGFKDGNKEFAQFDTPMGICFNNGRLYVGDYNNGIRVVTFEGNVRTLGDVKQVSGIAFHEKENSFYATEGGRVLKITGEGKVVDTLGQNKFSAPHGIAIDQSSGVVFVSDFALHKIFVIRLGMVYVYAGSERGFKDGEALLQAQFDTPQGICYNEKEQTLLVCDNGNNKIRAISRHPKISTTTIVNSIYEISNPRAVAITSHDRILVAGSQLFQLIQQGDKYKSSTLVGKKVAGADEEWDLRKVNGIAVHENSNSCFISETGSFKIKRVFYY